jgi:co-chaperonin GroES (HSP10)
MVRVERRTPDCIAPGERLRPLRDQIVVKVLPLKLSETIEAEWKGKPVRGTVIACGPGRFPNIYKTGKRDGRDYRTVRESTQFRKTEVKVGDIVELGGQEIGGYLFTRIDINGEECVLCSEQDVAIVHG